LAAWRARIGDAEADRISAAATARGTLVHAYAEASYRCERVHDDHAALAIALRELGYVTIELSNRFGPAANQMARNLVRSAKALCPPADVWCQETALWSCTRRYAGSVDMVGLWHGTPAIIDFKTAAKPKREEWITDYWLQTTAYALAHNELFGSTIETLVILITCETGEVQTFVGSITPWIDALDARLATYYQRAA